MKKIILLTFLTFIFKVYSQNPASKDFKKAKFTYSQKSNYEFDEKGVYADSILFIKDFPGIKYSFTSSPKNKKTKVAFIPFSLLTQKNIGYLKFLIYHTNILTEATYYSKSQKTEIYCYYCPDDETKKIMTLLKGSCQRNKSFPTIKKYTDGSVSIDNSVETTKKDISKSLVEFSDENKTIGSYEVDTIDATLTNVVQFDAELHKHITPIEIFANSDYGVKNVFSALYTIELLSVSYK